MDLKDLEHFKCSVHDCRQRELRVNLSIALLYIFMAICVLFIALLFGIQSDAVTPNCMHTDCCSLSMLPSCYSIITTMMLGRFGEVAKS